MNLNRLFEEVLKESNPGQEYVDKYLGSATGDEISDDEIYEIFINYFDDPIRELITMKHIPSKKVFEIARSAISYIEETVNWDS